MNEILTLEGLSAPLLALRLLALDFPHLPAPVVDVSAIYPDRLALTFHEWQGAFTSFETWRAALGIDPSAVDFHMQCNSRTGVLNTQATYGGADIELTAFTQVPATAGVA